MMYGKIFASLYDGSIYGKWEAIVTFQQMIVLADRDGVVDITPQALSARTSIPLDIIEKGIEILESPDPASRTPDEEGRRILRLDEDRPWGWRITNHAAYRQIRTAEDRREYHRRYYHEKRKTKDHQHELNNSQLSQQNQPIAYASVSDPSSDIELLIENEFEEMDRRSTRAREQNEAARRVLDFLNEKTGRNYRPTSVNLDKITARLREDYTETQCRQVIVKKCREWIADEKMAPYLRPATLFGREKFNQYAGELGQREVSHDFG